MRVGVALYVSGWVARLKTRCDMAIVDGPKCRRCSLIKKVLREILRRMDVEVRRLPSQAKTGEANIPFGGYDMEEEARTAIRCVQSHTMLPYRRLVVLYQQVVHCERQRIAGCYVECGTWTDGV